MKGAGKGAGVTVRLATDWHTPMTTDIQEYSYLPVFITDDNDGSLRHSP